MTLLIHYVRENEMGESLWFYLLIEIGTHLLIEKGRCSERDFLLIKKGTKLRASLLTDW